MQMAGLHDIEKLRSEVHGQLAELAQMQPHVWHHRGVAYPLLPFSVSLRELYEDAKPGCPLASTTCYP